MRIWIALLFAVSLSSQDLPKIPQADQTAYWRELANFHYIDANLQKALKQAQELSQQLAQQDKAVAAAKAKLETGCGAGFELNATKFQQGTIECSAKPKK